MYGTCIYIYVFFFSKIGPTLVEETSKNLESILCLQKPLKRWIFFTFNDIFSFLLALVIKRDTGCIVVIYIFDGTASAMFADVTNIPYIMKNHSFLQQSHIRWSPNFLTSNEAPQRGSQCCQFSMDQMWIIGSRPPFLVLDEIDAHLDHSNVQVDRENCQIVALRGLGGTCECRNLGRNVVTWELNLQKLMSDETLGEVSPVKMGLIFTGSWAGCPNLAIVNWDEIDCRVPRFIWASTWHISTCKFLLFGVRGGYFMPRDQQQHIHWSGHGICVVSTIRIDMLLVEIHR